MNRIDRISAILIQLQSRRVVKAQDIADRFGISLRTVYRDIKTLEEAGIPIIGEAGIGYSLVDGYRLPPVMFTPAEAIAFLTAGKLVEKLTDGANGASYKSALFKIKSVLKNPEKELLADMDNAIEVLQAKGSASKQMDLDLLQPILKSISEKRLIHLHYFAYYSQTYSERTLEPIGVFYLDNYWHLIAFCQLRQDYRDFRLDRIVKLDLSDCYFHPNHPSLQTYLYQKYKDRNLWEVIIQVDQKAARYLGEQKYYHGYLSEILVEEGVEMCFLTESLEGFARWFLMYADHAKIIKPDELHDRVSGIITKIAENFQELRSC